MTELAALNIRITGDSADLSAAVSRATGDLQKIESAAKRANTATTVMASGMGRGGAAMASLSANSKQLSWQLSQIVQQGTVTGQWAQAFAVQLGDIVPLVAGGGLLAAGISSLAMVGLPLLADAFMSGGEEAATFADTLDHLKSVTDEIKAAQDILAMSLPDLYAKYGLYAAAVRDAAAALVELNIAEAQDALNNAIIDGADALGQFAGAANTAFQSGVTMQQGLVNIRDSFGLVGAEASQLQRAFVQLQQAAGFDEQVRAANNLLSVMTQLGVPVSALPPELRNALVQTQQLTIQGAELKNEMNNAASATSLLSQLAPKGGWLSGAISDAKALGAALWDAANAKAAAGFEYGTYTEGGMDAARRGQMGGLGGSTRVSGAGLASPRVGGGGGGGGGGTNPIVAELEALQNALMTQEQAQIDSFTRQQETLRSALEQRLITQQEYNSLMEEAQRQHGEAMSQIDAYRYGDGLLKAETFMGDMAEAMAMGSEKMQGVARKFAAVEALINAWRSYSQTLADPSLPFFAKFAAAAKVFAAGMGAVNAIKGGGGGGGTVSSAASASAAGAQSSPLMVSLNTIGSGDFISRADLGNLLDRLSQAAGDRGYKIMVPA